MVLLSPECVVKLAASGIKEVYERIKALSANDELRQRIERRTSELKQVADELKESGVESFPLSCSERLQDFEDSISTCQRICANLKDKGTIGRFIQVHSHTRDLEDLDKQLEKAQQSLHFALTRAIHAQNRELKRCIQEGQERAEATTIHPSLGVYTGAGVRDKRPHQISKPEVSVVDDLLEVKWTDTKNSAEDLSRYEVRYDDEDEKIWRCKPEEHRLNKSDTFTLALGSPKVRAGRQYTISVRAVNSHGPGKWSDQTVSRFKIGPPNKPRKPRMIVQSPIEIIVEVPRLDEKEENGSPVHQCVVEYLDINDSNASDWSRLACSVKRRDRDIMKMSLKCLIPDTTYRFRVKMVNEAGESAPSDSDEAVTTQLIPGPPRELRISSKRLSNLIKIRWKKPEENPQAVSKYQVQRQLAKTKETPWNDVTTVDGEKLSAKATNLSSGTDYRFRVRAINNKQQCSEFSLLEAETRCGAAARIAASTGAFVGGTLGGPLVGAVGFGYMAGSSASDGPDSKAGKAAAATAAGIGGGVGGAIIGTFGAPLIGTMAAAMAYRNLAKGSDEWSPQTSEDEDEDSWFEAMLKTSRKKSEDMVNKKK